MVKYSNNRRKKLQKQLSALLLVSATAGIMVSTSVSAEEMIPSDQKISSAQARIVYEYTQEELGETVFTMELFNENFTREDVAKMIIEEKGAKAELSNEYRRFTATEAEIDEFYAEMQAIAAKAPSLSYYFSNVYWQMRTVATYGSTPTLTLVPTSVIRNDPDQNHRSAAWLLVKSTCSSSDKWTNEASISKQFDCHYMGEVLHYRGVIGAVGNWDIEPVRPAYGAFTYTVNKCNPV